MSDVSQWDVAAANNNDAPPDGFPENQLASSVNDAARELMAAVARWYSDTDGTLTTGGSSNTYTLTTNSGHAALADQSLLVFIANHANTGAATLNVDALGAKSLRVGGSASLVANQILADVVYVAAYNATDDAYDIVGAFNNDASNLTQGELPDARLSSNVPLKDASNTFTGATQTISAATFPAFRLVETGTGADWRVTNSSGVLRLSREDGGSVAWGRVIGDGAGSITEVEFTAVTFDLNGNIDADGTTHDINGSTSVTLTGTANAVLTLSTSGISASGAVLAPLTTRSTSTTLAMGQVHSVTAGVTIPDGQTAGNWVAVYNNSASPITLTQDTSLTLRLGGTATTGNRTLAQRGLAVMWYEGSNEAVCIGQGVS